MKIYTKTGDDGQTGLLGPGASAKTPADRRLRHRRRAERGHRRRKGVPTPRPPSRTWPAWRPSRTTCSRSARHRPDPDPSGQFHLAVKGERAERFKREIDAMEEELTPLTMFILPWRDGRSLAGPPRSRHGLPARARAPGGVALANARRGRAGRAGHLSESLNHPPLRAGSRDQQPAYRRDGRAVEGPVGADVTTERGRTSLRLQPPFAADEVVGDVEHRPPVGDLRPAACPGKVGEVKARSIICARPTSQQGAARGSRPSARAVTTLSPLPSTPRTEAIVDHHGDLAAEAVRNTLGLVLHPHGHDQEGLRPRPLPERLNAGADHGECEIIEPDRRPRRDQDLASGERPGHDRQDHGEHPEQDDPPLAELSRFRHRRLGHRSALPGNRVIGRSSPSARRPRLRGRPTGRAASRGPRRSCRRGSRSRP